MLGVHESTISRKLDKLARSLRKQIVDTLGCWGMSRRQAEEALEVDVRDLQVDIRRSLRKNRLRPRSLRRRWRPESGGRKAKRSSVWEPGSRT